MPRWWTSPVAYSSFVIRHSTLRMPFLRAGRLDGGVAAALRVLRIGVGVAAEQAQRRGGDVLGGEAELLHVDVGGGRRAEAVDADRDALGPGPALPAEGRRRLDRDALADGRRQDAVAVGPV